MYGVHWPSLVVGMIIGFVVALGIVEWIVSDLKKWR